MDLMRAFGLVNTTLPIVPMVRTKVVSTTFPSSPVMCGQESFVPIDPPQSSSTVATISPDTVGIKRPRSLGGQQFLGKQMWIPQPNVDDRQDKDDEERDDADDEKRADEERVDEERADEERVDEERDDADDEEQPFKDDEERDDADDEKRANEDDEETADEDDEDEEEHKHVSKRGRRTNYPKLGTSADVSEATIRRMKSASAARLEGMIKRFEKISKNAYNVYLRKVATVQMAKARLEELKGTQSNQMVQSSKVNRKKDYIHHVNAETAQERIIYFTDKLAELREIEDPADEKSHKRNIKYYENKIEAYKKRLEELQTSQ